MAQQSTTNISMSKEIVFKYLTETFGAAYVIQYLNKFPDDHVFHEDTYLGDFIDYINNRPAPRCLPKELWQNW